MGARILLAAAFTAAGVCAAPAAARCILPELVASDAIEAAKFLHGAEDLIIDGIVKELPRGDNSLFQRIIVVRYLKGEGPQAIDIWPGPGKPIKHVILDNTDEWGRIDAPAGARVVTALRKTPYGWTVGECAYQALAVPGVEDALRDGRWVVREGQGEGEE